MTPYVKVDEQTRVVTERVLKRVPACAAEQRTFNQSFFQAAIQAVCQENQEELAYILKNGRKLRKFAVSLPGNEQESFCYEAGMFVGAYKVLADIQDNMVVKGYHQKQKVLLERKHVPELLAYLHQNPNARQKNIASAICVQPNHLSEILNHLMQAGYVERYGQHKGTQYCLTKLGRQAYGEQTVSKPIPGIFVEGEYREIQDKERFLEVRVRKGPKKGARKEDGCAKWKTNFSGFTTTQAGG